MPVNGNTNQVILLQPVGDAPTFPAPQTIAGQPGYPASGPLKGAAIPYWFYGVGNPTTLYGIRQFPIGTMYTRTDAGVGVQCLFVFTPNSVISGVVQGKWTALV